MYDRNFKFPQNSKEEVSIDTASHKTWIDPISDDDTYVQIRDCTDDRPGSTYWDFQVANRLSQYCTPCVSPPISKPRSAVHRSGTAFPIERSITIKNYSIRRRQVPIHASDRLQFSEALLDLRSRGTGVSTYSIICRTGSLNFNGAITSTKTCLSDVSETNCGEGEITRPGKTDFSTMTRRNQLTWELFRLFNSLLMQFRGLK